MKNLKPKQAEEYQNAFSVIQNGSGQAREQATNFVQ
jgi:hypothetical protein